MQSLDRRPDLRQPRRLRRQYGHRNDVEGYAGALEQFDAWLPDCALAPAILLILTADHGCDPTTPSTDHSREYVPLLDLAGVHAGGVNLGLVRPSPTSARPSPKTSARASSKAKVSSEA